MDKHYMTQMTTSFLEELTEIEKQAGPLQFLAAGTRRLGRALSHTGKKGGGGFIGGLGGRGAREAGEAAGAKGALGNIGAHMKQIYRGGAGAIGKGSTSGGVTGGLGALARSRYGQMAGALAVPAAVGYGAHRVMS